MVCLDDLPVELVINIAQHLCGDLNEAFNYRCSGICKLIRLSRRCARIITPLLYQQAFTTKSYKDDETERTWTIAEPPEWIWQSAKYWESDIILDYWRSVPLSFFKEIRYLNESPYRGEEYGPNLMLHSLAAAGSISMVRLLLAKGIGPNNESGSTLTPLILAVQESRSPEMCKLLLDAGADITERALMGSGPNALCYAALLQSSVVLSVLINHCSENNISIDIRSGHNNTALSYALTHHAPSQNIRQLLDAGADMLHTPDPSNHNIERLNAFQLALFKKRQTVSLLMIAHLEKTNLDQGLNCIAAGWLNYTPIHFAITQKMWVAAEWLIRLGCDLLIESTTGDNALSYALKFSAVPLLHLLIEYGPPVWPQSTEMKARRTFRKHVAAHDLEGILMLKKLVDLKRFSIDYNQYGPTGSSLHIAILSHRLGLTPEEQQGHLVPIFELLLQLGVSVDVQNSTTKMTALHIVYNKPTDMPAAARVLINASSSSTLGLQDINGNTPLMLAITNRRYSTVEALLSKMHPADVHVTNNKGNSAFAELLYGPRDKVPEELWEEIVWLFGKNRPEILSRREFRGRSPLEFLNMYNNRTELVEGLEQLCSGGHDEVEEEEEQEKELISELLLQSRR